MCIRKYYKRVVLHWSWYKLGPSQNVKIKDLNVTTCFCYFYLSVVFLETAGSIPIDISSFLGCHTQLSGCDLIINLHKVQMIANKHVLLFCGVIFLEQVPKF